MRRFAHNFTAVLITVCALAGLYVSRVEADRPQVHPSSACLPIRWGLSVTARS